MKKDMIYSKYFSNGQLPELNNHICACCHMLKNNTDIFVFVAPEYSGPFSWQPLQTTNVTTYQQKNNLIYNPYASSDKHQVFLCAECVLELSRAISHEALKNIVKEAI